MFKRVAISTTVIAGLFAISAAQRTGNPSLPTARDLNSGAATIVNPTDKLTDDPVPCPNCDPETGDGPIARLSAQRTDDPVPCPNCDPETGDGPIARLMSRK